MAQDCGAENDESKPMDYREHEFTFGKHWGYTALHVAHIVRQPSNRSRDEMGEWNENHCAELCSIDVDRSAEREELGLFGASAPLLRGVGFSTRVGETYVGSGILHYIGGRE